MAAIMESNGVRTSKLGSSDIGVEEISMSRLDSIDKEEPGERNEDMERDQLIDHSSEDSGTECRHAGMLGSREDAFHVQSPASSPGESSLDHQLVWENKSSHAGEICDHFMNTTGPVIGLVARLPECNQNNSIKTSGHVSGPQPERTFFEDDDGSASNDRDSGHGGEIKAQQNEATNTMCDSGHAELVSDVETPHASIPGDSNSSICSLSSSQTCAASTASSSPLLIQSSQQQLPHSNSRSNMHSNATSHQQHNNQNRLHLPNMRQRHIDLPLPPPPPSPPSQSNLPTSTTLTAAPASLASEVVSIRDGKTKGKLQSQTNGSSDYRQPQEKLDIGFTPPQPPPSPPNIA